MKVTTPRPGCKVVVSEVPGVNAGCVLAMVHGAPSVSRIKVGADTQVAAGEPSFGW